MALSSKDIETLWKKYSEGVNKRGISVVQFFESNGVPYNAFEKWYKNNNKIQLRYELPNPQTSEFCSPEHP